MPAWSDVFLQSRSEHLMNVSQSSLMKCWKLHWPSFPSQGCTFTCVNHKSRLSPDSARGGMCSHRQPDFASCLVHLFFELCHIVLVGNYLRFSPGWTLRGCRAASCQVHWLWQGAYLRKILGNINQKVSQWQTYHRNCYPGYCRNWDPGFLQAGHVLYDTQSSEQPFSLVSWFRQG